MAMKPVDFDGAVPVDGYGPGFFRVDGQVTQGAVIVTPQGARPWGGLSDLAPVIALAGQVDVLFLGTGADIARAPAGLVDQMQDLGVVVEAMASPTAARTYNLTLAEGRRVACALLAV